MYRVGEGDARAQLGEQQPRQRSAGAKFEHARGARGREGRGWRDAPGRQG